MVCPQKTQGRPHIKITVLLDINFFFKLNIPHLLNLRRESPCSGLFIGRFNDIDFLSSFYYLLFKFKTFRAICRCLKSLFKTLNSFYLLLKYWIFQHFFFCYFVFMVK